MEGRSATVEFEVPGKLTFTAIVIGRSAAECEHLKKFVDQVRAGEIDNPDASVEFKDGALHLSFTTVSRDHQQHTLAAEQAKVVAMPTPQPNAPIEPEDAKELAALSGTGGLAAGASAVPSSTGNAQPAPIAGGASGPTGMVGAGFSPVSDDELTDEEKAAAAQMDPLSSGSTASPAPGDGDLPSAA